MSWQTGFRSSADGALEAGFMFTHQCRFARPALGRLAALAACVALIAAPLAEAQAPAATGSAAQAPSPEELEKLVGPIALYPDDLVALILPASTNPLQMVQAERFLEKRKKDPKLPINPDWDDSVKSLVNYPEVVKRMSDDLDWTADLGEAVVANQGAVLDAVQGFRRKAQSAGNLKTDAKQQVVVEQEVIKIVPSDPQVVYVPQYNPTTVVAYSSVPAYGYYPYAYPSYYYPYAPGAALATGLIWGAAIGAAWSGNHYGASWGGGNNNITVNRNTNVSGSTNINRSQRSQSTAWKSDKRPGQVSSGAGRPNSSRFAGNRPGDAGGAGGARGTGAAQRGGDLAGGARGGGTQRGAEGAGGARGSQLADAGGGRGTQQRGADAGGARGSTQRGAEGAGGGRGSSQLGAQGAGGGRGASGMQGSASRAQSSGGALGGYGSGNAARANSSRGAASRSSMGGGGARGGGGRRGR
jgi:hypothetical protein